MHRVSLAVLLALVFASAGCDQPLTLSGSCGGSHTSTCAAYAYSEVMAATIEPASLRPGQLGATARVHIVLATCGATGPAHTVRILARTASSTSLDDAGTDGNVYMLGAVADDGTNGDPVAGDGVIDATIGNPFTSVVPGDTNLMLEFTPHAEPHCDGTKLELAYTTGPTYSVVMM